MTEAPPEIASLLGRSVDRASARDANQAIARLRRSEGTEDKPAVSYEVVLPMENPLPYLTEVVLPRLVYFLDCSGAKLPRCSGVFLSLFWGNDLFFVRAADALEELGRLTGLTPAQMTARYGQGSR